MPSDRYQPLAHVSHPERLHSAGNRVSPNFDQRLRRTARAMLGHWKVLACCLAVSAAVGYVLAERNSSLRWKLESKLLYSRPAGITSYTPPDADSLSKLLKSPKLLAELSNEFEGVTPAHCDAALTVAPPYGSCVVNVMLDWHDPIQGKAILNHTMALFQQQVAAQRTEALAGVLEGLVARRQRCKDRMLEVREAQNQFVKQHGVSDVDTEMSALRADISEIERELAVIRSQRQALEAQYLSVANPKHSHLQTLVDHATAEHRNRADTLGELLTQKRGAYHHGFDFARELTDLNDEVESCALERQRLDDEISIVEQLRAQPTSGFTVAQPAVESLDGPKSNKRKILLATVVLGCLLCGAPLAVIEFARSGNSRLSDWTSHMGLPILVQLRTMPDSDLDGLELSVEQDLIRLLALRIQQSLERPNSVIMFCGLGYAPTSEWLLWNVSRCFAQRGERVLLLRLASIHDVIDEPAGEPNSGELVASGTAAEGAHSQAAPRYPAVMRGQSFGDGRENLSELVRSTNVLGVDELRSADLPWPREAWGTQRMTALLDALRERYTLVLISGPTVAQPVDLQMLAARVDGIVFTAPRGKRLHPSATAVANDLLRLRASVLGVIA